MAGLLPAAMRTELARPGGLVAGVLTLELAGGDRSYSDRPIGSDTLGNIKGDVAPNGWGRIRRAASDHNHSLSLSGTTVTILDKDRRFARLLRDENRYTLTDSAATIKLISPNVVPASWATYFSGVLDTFERSGPFQYLLKLSPREKPLLGPWPKLGILPPDFPNPGDRSVYGLWAPCYWGIHDSRGTTDTGMVPCPYVDRLGNGRYLVCFGWAKNVPRVYRPTGLATPSTYTITHPLINGRRWTLINPTSSWGGDEVFADVEGYEAVGDGSGALITGANVLKHQMVNFVYNEAPSGVWLADAAAPVHVAGFAAAQTFLERQGWLKVSAAYGLSAQSSGKDAIARFLRSVQALKAFFTRDGQLSLAPNDHATTTLYYDEPRWIRFDRHERGQKEGTLVGPVYLRDNLADRISAEYLFDTAGGAFRRNLEVRDISIDRAQGSVDLPLSHASLEA